jgi:putative flippase GtrA
VLSPSPRAAFFRFACVGLAMAVVDIGVLYLLKDQPGLNVYLARLISYASSLTVGYVLNRNFTFHHVNNERHILDELLRYFAVHSTGGLLNLGVFTVVVFLGDRADLTPAGQDLLPLAGVCLGGVVGMCFNFVFSRALVFDG